MKKSELRQMIREEYQRSLSEVSGNDKVDKLLSTVLQAMSQWEAALKKADFPKEKPQYYKSSVAAIAQFKKSVIG